MDIIYRSKRYPDASLIIVDFSEETMIEDTLDALAKAKRDNPHLTTTGATITLVPAQLIITRDE